MFKDGRRKEWKGMERSLGIGTVMMRGQKELDFNDKLGQRRVEGNADLRIGSRGGYKQM